MFPKSEGAKVSGMEEGVDTHFLWVIAVDEEVVALVDHDVVRTLVQDLGRKRRRRR